MILDLILVAIIIIFAIIGAKKGFIDTILGFVNKIAALLIALIFAKPFASVLESTSLYDLASNITSKLDNINIALISNSTTLKETLNSWILIAFAFIILYIVSYLLIKILRKFADTLTSLPILKQVDSLAGFALGVCESLIVVFILLGIMSLFESMSFFTGFFETMESSYLTKYLYDNNFIVNILFSVDAETAIETAEAVVSEVV
ncbi:MAG: CvpA family protein [Bacillota bacterium]